MKTVQIAGESYVAVARASEILGYSRDYIGQLCRSGSLVCKRSSGQWFVLEGNLIARSKKDDALANNVAKEAAAKTLPNAATEENVTPVHKLKTGTVRDDVLFFDKEEYVTSARAAEITGYAQDYVGELARSKAVSARKVGRHWMIHKQSILDHKQEKDALLAGVQADSAGFFAQSGVPEKHEIPIRTRYFSEDYTPLPFPAFNTEDLVDVSFAKEKQAIVGQPQNTTHKSPSFFGAEQFFPRISTDMYTAPAPIVGKETQAPPNKSYVENGLHKPNNDTSDRRYGIKTVKKETSGTVAHDSPYAVHGHKGGNRLVSIGVLLVLVGMVFAGYWYRDKVVAVAQNTYQKAQESTLYSLMLDIVPGRGVEYFSE